ncbi:MAG TPA: DNA mismatch repair protein MutS [Phycisphaerales bacterium]|nr:DNA mismatch repair protein MutS [Phycisphaerales bacterium]
MPADPRDTPAMRQYFRFKRQHPDCTLLFRIGDFYEMFDDDAVRVSQAIGLTLTQRTEGVPMAGVPFHQLETYLRKLLSAGFRVAVCEQTETPEAARERGGGGAVIERAVTRVLTPGTLVDESLLESDAPSALGAVCFVGEGDHSPASVAVIDLSTGRFELFESSAETLADELSRRGVTELLYAQTADGKEPPRVKAPLGALGISGTPVPSWYFRLDEAREAVLKQYGVATLDGFGLSPEDDGVRVAGAALRYLQTTQTPEDAGGTAGTNGNAQKRTLAHLQPPKREQASSFCVLDGTTLRSLEVLRTIRGLPNEAETDGSLLGIFSASRTFPGCRTAMGKRLLREWLCRPLCSIEAIAARQRCVATLIEDRQSAGALAAAMENVQDIARIAGRLALDRANPRDLCALGRSLSQVAPVGEAITNAPAFASQLARIEELKARLGPLSERIAERCVDDPPPHLREGGLFRDGFDPELDEARRLKGDGAAWMAEYQARLIEEHQLPSLKVGYNRVFGYYIELPSAQSKRAPDQFTRKQTLKNAERYITPELKDFEQRASTAEARALAREQALFEDLCERARALIAPISAFADTVAELDVLACFAEKALKRRWVRPDIVEEPILGLEQARHPVLDERLEQSFVPNDLWLGAGAAGRLGTWSDSERCQGGEVARSQGEDAGSAPSTPGHLGALTPSLALITGPNMAGKSTFIRTAALLTLLAHTGSFVPADRAVVGLTDRIFTRIGADDALHAGQSTFMVEMTETARILNHATARSLIILDEIGRGTSTLDGLSLAWAIAETLAGRCRGVKVSRCQGEGADAESLDTSPRTLFATHYHELTDLEELLPGRIINLHVSVREWGEEIVFLHRILPGRTDRSYGVHVAKLAGLPAPTVARAKEILETLAVQHHGPSSPAPAGEVSRAKRTTEGGGRASRDGQLALFTEYVPHPAVNTLREIKLDSLSPMQAFDVLRKLKDMTEDGPKAST